MSPKEFLGFVKKELDSKKEFEWWKLLEGLENAGQKISNSRKGIVEENVHVDGNLEAAEGAIVKSGTRIEGNAYIGRNSIIGPNAYLRKDVIIGEGCHVSNSEIKNSVILNNSNVPHYSYVGDSIIGENVNFGAGAKIANLRFDNKTVKVSIKGKKIDSGKRKLGALVNSGSKIGINACINCGIIIGKNCFVKPGAFVEKNLPGKIHSGDE
ncbi:MAG: DapH/DapD/GlmU-related protein [Candidatus Diapherotrites archaeon]